MAAFVRDRFVAVLLAERELRFCTPLLEAAMSLSEWLDSKTNTNRLDACDLVLGRFCADADASPDYLNRVGEAVWRQLPCAPAGKDPAEHLAEMRDRAAGLGRERLDVLSAKLQHATETKSEFDSVAGKLVASWFRAIALSSGPRPQQVRAAQVVRAYERAFSTLARLTPSAQTAAEVSDAADHERVAA